MLTMPERRKTRKPWIEEVDDARQAVLAAWLKLLTGREARSLVGRQLQAVGEEEHRMQSLVDSLIG
eukprot:5547589-Amphidinium_carterae.1